MRRRSVVQYRRFGIDYRSHIQGSSSPRKMTETLRCTVLLEIVWAGALLTVLITAQILLLIQEAAMAVIQSYVFAMLRNLYSREVN